MTIICSKCGQSIWWNPFRHLFCIPLGWEAVDIQASRLVKGKWDITARTKNPGHCAICDDKAIPKVNLCTPHYEQVLESIKKETGYEA